MADDIAALIKHLELENADLFGYSLGGGVALQDADAVRTAHAVQFFELLGGGQGDAGWDGAGMTGARLAILPGTTHHDIFSSPVLASIVVPFLDAPMPGPRGSAMSEKQAQK